MTSSENKWISSDDKDVLFMDIMGFKERVGHTDFLDLQKQINDLCTKWKKRISPLMTGGHLEHFQFSDSIILTTDETTPQTLNLITRASATIMQEAMLAKFPINGAISKGQFSFDKENQIFFGNALVEAYLLQSTLFYYGVAIHPKMYEDVETFLQSKEAQHKKTSNLLSNIRIPLKGGAASYYQINWNLLTKRNYISDETEQALSTIEPIEKHTTGNPRIYIENTRRIIYAVQKEYTQKTQRKKYV